MSCRYCHNDTHSSFTCFKRPKKPIKQMRRMKQMGKIGKAYIELRKGFFILYPGDEHYCYYCLSIGIEVMLTKKQTQVEHFYSKALHPDRRFDMGNLVASCAYHNKLKGSMDGLDFIELIKEQQIGTD